MTATTYDSRLKSGQLTLKTTGTSPVTLDVACQARNVRLVPPKGGSTDADEVLNGNKLAPEEGTGGDEAWRLAIISVQDFTNPNGVVMFLFDHEGETVDYTWLPTAGAKEWYGSCVVNAMEIGGLVNKRLETEVEMPCTGKPQYRTAT